MHVVFLAPDIDLSGYTGDVWHVKDLTLAFARAGCVVDLVVANPAAWFGGPNVRMSPTPRGSFLAAARTLKTRFLDDPPDVLYERRGSPKLSATLGHLLHRPYFVEINGLVEEEKQMQGRPEAGPGWLLQIKRSARGRLFRSSAGIVAVTNGLKDALIEMHRIPPALIRVIPNGVDIDVFRPMPVAEAREVLSVPRDAAVAVFVGNLVAWQGVSTLLEAASIARRDLPGLRLYIVGDGIERKALEAMALQLGLGDSVRFLGRVPRDEVPRWIAAADVGVLPSTLRRNLRIGSSALKLREYLACGRPAIATNLEGAGPMLEAAGVGVGVRGDDAPDLGRALVSLLNDPSRRADMGRKAREFAERELSWDRVAGRVLELFREVLAHESGSVTR